MTVLDRPPSLFDVLPPKRAATLEETRLRDQQILVLEALVDAQVKDPIGHHAFGLQSWLRDRGRDRGIERNAVSSRLHELDKWFGFVVKVDDRHAPTGKPEKCYAPTADGAEWVRLRRERS